LVGRNFKGVTEQVSSIESVNRALQFWSYLTNSEELQSNSKLEKVINSNLSKK
jgi:hypothetical protein